jgi:hypothetical protein
LGHCALSQTVCNRKSEISALVEKKTGFDGNRTLIQGGLCAWCNAGSIFAQDIKQNYNVQTVTKVKSPGGMAHSSADSRRLNLMHALEQFRFARIQQRRYHRRRVAAFSLLDRKLKPD